MGSWFDAVFGRDYNFIHKAIRLELLNNGATVTVIIEKQNQILMSQLAHMLDGMYEAREQGDIEQELRLRERMIPLLVQALTSKNDDLLELSVYCVSLLEEEAYREVMDKALSQGSDDAQITESIQRVTELMSRTV